MKKQLTLTVLAALLLASFASCGDAKNPSADTTADTAAADTAAETAAPSLLDDLGERDLGGMVYTIFDCNAHSAIQANIPGEEMNGEVINDALLTRDLYLEERYNCEIEYIQQNDINKLKSMVTAGDDEWQMIIATMVSLNSQATAGYLADMCAMPHLEMDQNWWNPLMYQNMRLHDAMYFTSSDIAPGVYKMPGCMFLNLKLYTDYDYDFDIFQSVIDGKWTVDQLRTMTKDMDNDLNMDNSWNVDDDFFGFAMQKDSTEAVQILLTGAGVQFSHINDAGDNITCDLLSDSHAVQVIEGVTDLFKTINLGADGDINGFSNILFEGDRALFFMHKLESAAVHLRDMESDYLILPAPKWDEKQESYYSFLSPWGSCFIALPQTVSGNENYGFLTEALARYSREVVRPVAYDLVYKEKDSRDERSAKVLDILLDCTYIDFASLYNFGSVNNTLVDVLYKDAPLASGIEKNQSKIDTAIADLVEAWKPIE
ncbi:MAG: hypothetical protein IJW77_03535 [Clostridia bacterium]|nr:hypothetical protein [Clostridia bacterium]